ncbi:hypothetical protein P7K49_013084 [Saguinus oedipus]|uniref:Uncharacterized protein n=1 Tax=Saguinus oedipus TaxID=9490 RepID=A0ABQ9VGA0_SAGOE|nr:hypothetical protein P7K49_013084 [Saguinus oedipus]
MVQQQLGPCLSNAQLHTLQPSPHFPKLLVRFLSSTNALSLCVLLGPVEVLQDLIKEDIEDDEMPPGVRNVFFWGLWDIKQVSLLTAIVNQTSVVMDSSDQSVEFLTNRGLIDDGRCLTRK